MITDVFDSICIILAGILLCISCIGVLYAHVGEYIFPRVTRARIIPRRRILMSGFMAIAIIVGAQSIYVGLFDECPCFPYSVSGTISRSLSLLILMIIACEHLYGWWREHVTLTVPLAPDELERVKGLVTRARAIAHSANSGMMIISGPLELALQSPNIDNELRREIETALSGVDMVANHIAILQDEIKALDTIQTSE